MCTRSKFYTCAKFVLCELCSFQDHDICGEILSHPSCVYRREVEQNKRIFVCNECSKEFRSKQLLQRHLSVHSEDRWVSLSHILLNWTEDKFEVKADIFRFLVIYLCNDYQDTCKNIRIHLFSFYNSLKIRFEWSILFFLIFLIHLC